MNLIKCKKCGLISLYSHGTPEGWISNEGVIICLECRLKKLEGKV